FTYTYIMKDPISFNVIFKVENGSWNNGSKDDVTVTLNGYEDDVLKLIADQIPLAGEKPDHGFKAGEWVVVPDTENPVTVEMVYTYAYEARTVFDVTFETRGGSVIDPVKVFEGDTVDAPADPVRKSFAFAGWFSDEGLATPFDFTVPVASDTVVYAAWENVVYTSDGSKSVTEGVPGDVVITVKRSHADETCFSHFAGVVIDGRKLEQGSDYTAAAGSTVVTLKTGVFENLAAGDHTVTVLIDDGEAETTLTVSPKVISPPTGEEFYATALLAFAVLMMLLTLAVTGIKKTRKR
ncbi:MAG: InlB B-repeat-containing protein, partial [Clostridia bacterium]|nr:InlB B-repeat-containing protein [Clostridia bacterium]